MSERLEDIAVQMVTGGRGLLAADESTSTIKKRFDTINLESTETSRRDYREMLFRSDEAMKKYISGVILYEETLFQKAADGTPFVDIIRAAGSIPGSPGACPGTSEGRRTLRRRGSLPRRWARGDLGDRRHHHLRLGGFDGSRFALDVRRRGAAFFLFGLRLDFLLRRGRGRRRRLPKVEHAHHALLAGQVQFPREIQEGVEQGSVDRDDRYDRCALVPAGDDLSIGHGTFNAISARALRRRSK